MNLLTDIIPAKARKYLYAAFALAGIIVGALAIAGVDTGAAPDVLAYLGVGLGLTAASNTPENGLDPAGYDSQDDDDLTYEEAGGLDYPEDSDPLF